MGARRVRSLLAAAAIAGVLAYALSGHGLPHLNGHDELAGAAVGLCLLVATALGFAATRPPRAAHTLLRRPAMPVAVGLPSGAAHDGRERASPSALQRFLH